jgi:hypothetical protein
MALSDMKVFNQFLYQPTIETLAQMVEKFNAASRGAIRLSTEGFTGDFKLEAMFKSLHGSQRRVNRYNTNTTGGISGTALQQIQMNTVKVAGGFGPIIFEPGQLTWILQNEANAIEVISRNLAEAIMRDMLNTGIAAAVAAVEAQTTATTFDAGTGPVTFRDINKAHAKFGDMSQSIVADVMDGASYHNLVDNALANAERLFVSDNILVLDMLGKAIVVTDAPALRETGTGADQKVLSLVTDGIVVHDAGDLITNIETTNGKARIETTMQADYTFGLGLKGYSWDATKKSPSSAELATGANWTKVATSIKDTAGVLTLADV